MHRLGGTGGGLRGLRRAMLMTDASLQGAESCGMGDDFPPGEEC